MIIYDKSNSHFDVLTNQIEATSTAQKMKFSIKDFFSKCDQIRRKLRIWPHLLKKSLMENFIFCAASVCINLPISLKLKSMLSFTLRLQTLHVLYIKSMVPFTQNGIKKKSKDGKSRK